MAAIVSGSSLGLFNTSLYVLGSQGALGQAGQGRAGDNVYVNAATGNLVIQNRDELVIGRGSDLSLLRTYNSQGLLNDDNGDNWRAGVYRKIYNLSGTVNTAGSTVTRVAEDGSESAYTYDATQGKYVSTDSGGAYDTLSYNGTAQTWTWTDGSTQATETYDAANGGRIVQTQDANGNGLTFTYNAAGLITQVSDASGETTYLDYTGNNLTDLRTVTADGQTSIRTRYAYDASNRLTQVITDLSPGDASIADGNTYSVNYTYDGASKRVASITQSDGSTVSFTYVQVNGIWVVNSYTDALGRTTTLNYAAGSQSSATENADQTALVVPPPQLHTETGNANSSLLQMAVPYNLNSSLLQTTDSVPHALNSSLLQTTNTVSGNLNSSVLTAQGWGGVSTLETTSTAASMPIVGFDAAGNGAAVWIQGSFLYARRYVNNVWGPQVTLSSNSPAAVNLYVDASGNAVAVWNTTGNVVAIARLVSGTWQATQVVGSGSNVLSSYATINGNGRAIVSWYTYDPVFGTATSIYARPYDPTTGLGTTTTISSTYSAAGIGIVNTAVDSSGNALLVYGANNAIFARAYKVASGWQAATQLGTYNASDTYPLPQVGFDSLGNAVALWTQGGLLTSRSYTNGVWNNPVQLSSSLTNTGSFRLSVDPSGNAVATWDSSNNTYVSRYVNGAWQTAELIGASNNAAGITPTENARINASGQAVVIRFLNSDVVANRYTPGVGWSGDTALDSLATNPSRISEAIDSHGDILSTWLQNNGADSVYSNFYDANPYYTVGSGATWSSIASALYGSTSLANKLQTVLGNPSLVTGLHLSGFPAALSDTFTVPPYYVVQTGDTWSSIATSLYGSPYVGDELQAALGNPVLTAGLQLTGLPATLTDTSTYAPFYKVQAGDTWSTVAASLYGSSNVGDELQSALGNPSLTTGLHISGIPSALNDHVAPYYTVRSGDTWSSIAVALYGSADYSGELQAAFGNVTLTPGMFLSNPPASLTHNWTTLIPPYYLVQSGDTWTTIAALIYGDPQAAAALQSALGNPALTIGLQLTVPPSLSFTRTLQTHVDVTDPLGLVTTLSYDANGELTDILAPAVNGRRAETQYTYDASGNVASVTDARGNVVNYGYDADGNRILERDAAGNTVTRVYDAKNELLAETSYLASDPDGAGAAQPGSPQTTRYAYDASGNLRFVVSAVGRVSEYRYNGFGQRIAAIQYTGALYDLTGLTPTSTLTESTLNAWLPANRSASLRTDTAYDFRGQVASTTSYASVDASGNGVADATQSVTQYVYDQAGNLLKTIDARGTATTDPTDYTTTYVYDGMGRLLSSTDALGNTTLRQYSDTNRQTVLTLASGLVSTSTYDAAGELVSVVQSANSQTLGTTSYFYDADGRLRRTQDPTGISTYVLYDEAGRKIGTIDGTGALTEYRYDADNNLTKTIQYATAVSASNLASLTDAQGRPTSVTLAAIRPATSSNDRMSWGAYDSANRLVKSVDAAGFVTQNFYDGTGQLTDVLRFAMAISTASLSDTPQPGSINPTSSGADRLTRNFYDADGKLRGTLDGEGYLSEYKYDAAGELVETVGYASATNASLRTTGTLAQLIPASSAADIHSYTLYNARGQVAGTVDGEGYLTESVYDAAGNKTQVIRYATPVSFTTGASLASLRPAASAQDQVIASTYTALNQVASTTGADGTLTQYSYDAVGHLVKTVSAANTSDVRTLLAQYDVQGRLTAQLSANGAAQLSGSLTQGQIDAIWAANATHYTYDAAGRRTSATDADGRKTLFYYDADGRLAYSVNALGEVTQSVYNALGQVTQSVQYGTRLSGATLATLSGGLVNATLTNAVAAIQNVSLDSKTSYAYYASGTLQQRTDALGNATTQTYDTFGDVVSQSQAIGSGQTLGHTYSYDRRGLLTLTVWDPSGANTTSSTVFDAFGRAIQSTDANGNVRTQSYDRLGRVVSSTDPLNRTGATSYDAFSRVLTQTDALGNTTTYSYDTANRTVTVTTSEGIVTTTVNDRHGEVLRVTDGRGNTTSYHYDRDGNLIRVDSPGAGSTTKAYDAADSLIQTIDANGTATTYACDAAGRVLTRTVDPGAGHLNLTTTYTYDAKGQGISTTGANGVVTQVQFDLKGQTTSVIVDPGTGHLNLTTTYTYDARGKKLTVTQGAGSPQPHVTQYSYDKLGRLLTERDDPNGINATTSYVYDKNNNVTKKTDAGGNVTRYAYDADDELVYVVNALGGVTKSDYNADGKLIRTTHYANAISLAGLSDTPSLSDIAARITTSAADEATGHVYDRDGREVYAVNALGDVTQKVYDANGNVIRTIAYANPIPASTPLTSAAVAAALTTSTNDRVTRTVYDAANRAAYTIDAGNYVKETDYDNLGQITKTIQYTQAVSVSAAPSVAEVAAALPADNAKEVNTFTYDAGGRLASSTDAEGFSESYTYDAAGNKLSFTNKKGATWTYAYDAAGRQTSEYTPQVAITSVDGTTLTATSATASIQTLTAYDALGNVTSRTEAYGRPEARTTQYQYDALGRQVKTIYPAVAVYNAAGDDLTTNGITGTVARTETTISPETDVSFDALGNATVNRDANGNYSYKVYDALGRVKYDIDAAQYVTQYGYDAFGNQTTVTRYATALNYGAVTGFAAHVDGVALSAAEVAARLTTSASDRTITTSYDALNHSAQVVEPTAYTYDPTAPAGQQYFTVGRTTQNTYNAFGQLTKQSILRNPLTNTWEDTYFYYGARGNKRAQIDALGNLSTWQYDAAGNLVQETQYAKALPSGSWNLSGYGTPTSTTPQSNPGSAIGYDRTTTYQYDRKNQKIAQTQVDVEYGTVAGTLTLGTTTGDLTTSYSYDGVGNLTSVTDPTGATTYSYYDALGHVLATAEPTRFSTGSNGTVAMPPVYVAYDASGNTTTLSFAKSNSTDTLVGFQYKTAGASSWTTATLQLSNNTYTLNLTGLPSDHYQYQITYTRTGDSSPYATGSGDFNIVGPTSTTSTNVVAAVQQPLALSFGIAASANIYQVSDGESGYYPAYDGNNAVNVSWSSLNSLGNGDVRVRLNYLTYQFGYGTQNGAGVYTSHDQVFSGSAALTGAAVSWYEPDQGGWHYGGVQAITSVEVFKVVDGQEIEVINSASGYTQSDQLLLRGKTAGLTGINVAGVGTLAATSFGAGVYTVSLAGLSRGTYSYTSVGTASTLGGTFDVTHSSAAGNAGLQEVNAGSVNRTLNAYHLPSSSANAVLQYRTAGSTGPYLSKTLNPAASGEFSIGYDDVANGAYEYILTVRDASGNLVNLTSVGGTGSGTLSGTVTIHRGGALPTVTQNANVQTLTPLTTMLYNAFGNVVQTTKYAKGAVSADASSYGVPVADPNDEITTNFYDTHGNVIRDVDPTGASKYSSYDALGHIVKSWQPVTNNDGLVNNAVQVYQYDKVGHQTATIEPSYAPNETILTNSNTPSATALSVGWSATSSAPSYEEVPDPSGDGWDAVNVWWGWNTINLSWNDMSSWGGGNIYARVYYYTGFGNATYRDAEVASTAAGTSLSWYDPGNVDPSNNLVGLDGGIQSVYAVQIWKRDVNGTLQQIQYRTTQGANGSEITVDGVPQQPGTNVAFKYTPQGQSTWSTLPLINMGSRYIVNTSGLNGNYNYEIQYTRPGESQPYSHVQGTFSVSSSLATGVTAGNSTATTYTPQPLNPANFVANQVQYDAFGEITAKGINNGWQQYDQYDNADRLWRTNQNGGANEVFLYDTQGKATSDIKSQTLDLKNAYSTPDQIAALSSNVQRTDTYYDSLERAVKQVQPTFYVNASLDLIPGAPSMPQLSVGWSATSSAPSYEEVPDPSGDGWDAVNVWWGWNTINLSWNDMSSWGGGNIYARVYYYTGFGNATYRDAEVASTAAGTSLSWYDPGNVDPSNNLVGLDGGIQSVYAVQIWKRDPSNNLVQVDYQTYSGASGNALVWQAPTVVNTQIVFKYQPTSSSNWTYATPVNFGGKEFFDTRGLAAGSYNYEILYTRPGDTTPYAHKTGVFTVGATPGVTDTTTTGTQLTSITPVTTQTLDRWGNTLSSTDARGYTTNYRYNSADKMVEQDAPLVDVWGADGTDTPSRPVSRNYYDKAGRGLGTIDANGNASSARYDAAGQLISEYHADGGVLSYQYDVFGRQVKTIDALGNATTSVYDRDDRVTQVTHPIGIESYAYDEAGNRIRATDATGNATKYWYDTRGKLIRTQLPGGQQTNDYYDARGNKVKEVNANSDQPTWSYDYFGHLLSHTDLGGATYTDTYDKAGHLAQQSVTRGGSTGVTTYTYYENGSVKDIHDAAVAGDTYYEYDAAGNRVRERYTKANVIDQDDHISFDALNRMSQNQDNRYTILYKYDANGNRRESYTSYYDNANVNHTIDSWYQYDNMNRITLSQGVLSNGSIQINASQGIQLQYDAAGNRRVATNYQAGALVAESYNYDADNHLTTTNRGGLLTSSRGYDAAGRVTENISFSSPGTISVRQENTYNANGQLTQQLSYNNASTQTQGTYFTGYDGLGNVTSYQVSVYTGTNYTNYYSDAYAKYDSYKQSAVYGSSTYFQAGQTTTSYDFNGNAVSVSDQFAANNYRSFVTDGSGNILQKTQNGSTQYYFYAGGKPVGSSGALSAADFDYNYTPVSNQYPGMTPGTYVVSQGDTLRTIALVMFGDAQLWYVIADANGLHTDADLKVGQQLTIPNKITNVHNDYKTFKVYSPGSIIGDTTPTLPDPPPPPAPSANGGGGCGVVGMIVVAIIAIVVSYFLGPEAGAGVEDAAAGGAAAGAGAEGGAAAGAGAEGGVAADAGAEGGVAADAGAGGSTAAGTGAGTAATSGTTAAQSTFLQAATRAAVNNLATQAIGNLVGTQHGFSLQSLVTSIATAGIGQAAGVGNLPAWEQPLAQSAIQQGVSIVTGQQRSFDWRQMVVAEISAPVAQSVGNYAGNAFGDARPFASGVASDVASSVARLAVKQAVYGGGRISLADVETDAFGNLLGDSIVKRVESQQTSTLTQAEANANANANANDWTPEKQAALDRALARPTGLTTDSAPGLTIGDRYDQNYGKGTRVALLNPGDEGSFVDVGGRNPDTWSLSDDARAGADGAGFQEDLQQRRAADPFSGVTAPNAGTIAINSGQADNFTPSIIDPTASCHPSADLSPLDTGPKGMALLGSVLYDESKSGELVQNVASGLNAGVQLVAGTTEMVWGATGGRLTGYKAYLLTAGIANVQGAWEKYFNIAVRENYLPTDNFLQNTYENLGSKVGFSAATGKALYEAVELGIAMKGELVAQKISDEWNYGLTIVGPKYVTPIVREFNENKIVFANAVYGLYDTAKETVESAKDAILGPSKD